MARVASGWYDSAMRQQGTATMKSKKKRFDVLVEALSKFKDEINKNKPLRLETDLFPDKVKVKITEFVTISF